MKFSVAVALLASLSAVNAFQTPKARQAAQLSQKPTPNSKLDAVAIDPTTTSSVKPNLNQEPFDMTGIALSVSRLFFSLKNDKTKRCLRQQVQRTVFCRLMTTILTFLSANFR